MYKYIITAIIIALFAGCSAPKPETPPSWYTTLPKDFNFIYATAASSSKVTAKKLAIASLRKQINTQLDDAFKNKTTKLVLEENEDITKLLQANEYLANTLSMRAVQVDKSTVFHNEHLILIKLSRKTLFDALSKSTTRKLTSSKKSFQNVQNKIAIKRYIVIEKLMKDYPKLAALTEAKKVALASYATNDEFEYLTTLKQSYIKLKKDISVYVLSDVNSRVFAPAIKKAVQGTGLTVTSKTTSKDSIKILITSKTTESQNYSFNQSKSLVKFLTYDTNKKQIAFKQHTFIGKSRKSYQEAKEQSSLHVTSKVHKMGTFSFLGF